MFPTNNQKKYPTISKKYLIDPTWTPCQTTAKKKMYTQQANIRGLVIYSLVFLRGVLFTSKIVYN